MPTSSSARAALPPVLVVLAAACALLAGGVGLAGPAAAIEDPRRPTAEVTHGPSCGPGVVRVAVTNGTEPHHVVLVFDGEEQDAADLGGGEQVELTSEDVDWGTTVDVSLAVSDADGTVENPIQFGTYTRPSADDCAAVTPPPASGPDPTSAAPSATTSSSSTPSAPSATPTRPTFPGTPRSTSTAPAPSTPRSTSPAPTPATSPTWPTSPTSRSDDDGGSGGSDGSSGQAGSASAALVSPGGVVTVRATGFTPGEAVTVSLLGADQPLTTVTAGADGSVEAVVQIPRDAALGTATVQLVGGASSATAGLELQVAARTQPVAGGTTSIPVLAAGISLIGAAGVLGLTAARRSRGHHTPR